MKTIDENTLKPIADKLMFDIEDNQLSFYLSQINLFLDQFALLSEIPNIDEATPMDFPFDIETTYLRDDIVSQNANKEDILKNAKDIKDGVIIIPRVIKK